MDLIGKKEVNLLLFTDEMELEQMINIFSKVAGTKKKNQ